MADLTVSKQTFADQMQAIAKSVLLLAAQLDNLNGSFNVHGFNSGGANQFVDGDFTTSNQHLSAQVVNDVMFAIAVLLDPNTGQLRESVLNSLRECIVGGLP